MDELAAILAAAFLHVRAGMAFPGSQVQITRVESDKAAKGTESSLEPVSESRLCGAQKERTQ